MPFDWSNALKAIITTGVDKTLDDIRAANEKAVQESLLSTAKVKELDDSVVNTIAKNVDAWAKVSKDSVVSSLQDELTGLIQSSYKDGVSVQDLSRQLDKIFEGRGELIARTEVSKAINTGKFLGYQANGETHKQWIHKASGPNARESHQELEDQGPIPFDQPFITDLGEIMYPGDPSADVGDLCNCGCTMVPANDPEEE